MYILFLIIILLLKYIIILFLNIYNNNYTCINENELHFTTVTDSYILCIHTFRGM